MSQCRFAWALAGLAFVWLSGHTALAIPALDISLSVAIKSGETRLLTWQSPVTDANLENPAGYFPAAPQEFRVIERLTIRNTGDTAIKNPKLTINGRDFLTVDSLPGALGLSHPIALAGIYSAWKERRAHATSGMPENSSAIEVLRTFGVTLCGDDSKALAEIVLGLGGSVTPVRLIGHVAYEYCLNGITAVLDADQNIFYIRLDNQTPATEEDLRQDPFLAVRARVFGSQMPYQLASSWMNAARFAHLASKDKKPKKQTPPAPVLEWELLPGEWLEFFPTSNELPAVYAESPELAKNPILRESVIAVKFHPDLDVRRQRGDTTIRLPFPAVAWVNPDGSSATVIGEQDKLTYEVEIPSPMADGMALICQAAKGMFPGLPLRSNSLVFASAAPNGVLALDWTLNPSASKLQPSPPPTVTIDATLHLGVPVMSIDAPRSAAIWWQVSADSEFDHVMGNFDVLQKPSASIRIASPIETTYFNPGTEYFFRSKQQIAGVWSDWSESVGFQVDRPASPIDGAATQSNGKAVVTWEACADEIWIFGSNRMDFVAEIYSVIEPTRIENNMIVESVENKNLVVKVPGNAACAEVPALSFYRLIAHRAGRLSVPSPLIHTDPIDALPASTLQNQHQKPATDIATPVQLR